MSNEEFLAMLQDMLISVSDVVAEDFSKSDWDAHQALMAEVAKRLEEAKCS